jgi:diguanylate cyclase (GGDEF)-like protein
LKKLTSAAEMLADGNVDINLDDCKTKDEVGILAVAFEKTIEQLRGYMKYINALAYKDALTGIKNRTAYNEAATELDIKIKLGECEPFAVLAADVNDLKKTNDKYGHEIGNKLLIKSAKAICDVFKHSPVYRIGGDEFVALLYGEDYENYVSLLCQLDEKLSKTFIEIGDDSIKVSIASAIAIYENDTDVSFDDVFNRADKRMYENKASSKTNPNQ